ncbi:MAG TPA: bifunctional phosphopantothenoylcysteine decarboxylase/phosphopantothenate--cysteine ligase CoaBC [Candidatus Coprenecus merdigallinarum]|nr:bifunctional phosphopantothenoylcysteine decarboxylase/phosphopantothenate--cysteine ligase CoaBC [Candidatus Coprenecus merdigallinarum]
MQLKGKHILLGITGSIAAYKAAYLTRLLVREGAEVKVVMTAAAKQFITPLTMATLSRNPILVEFFDPENGQWNSHVSLGLWADLYLIAPATANTLSKMACGIADNLLLTTYLSARCPVMAAPAMDLDMYAHPATQESMRILRERGVHIVEASSGELASGLEGKGRMEDPEKIVGRVAELLASGDKTRRTLSGRKAVVTSGPTREAIDPVRFISNHSSGKMASAIADELSRRGAQVTVVSGPAAVYPSEAAVRIRKVISAGEMYQAAVEEYDRGCDITVLCAAVADFTPASPSGTKIKKDGGSMTLELLPTKDIAAAIGERRRSGGVIAGFALETDHARDNALSKLRRKNMDMIVLNSMQDAGAGFGVDTNKVTVFRRDGSQQDIPLCSKTEVASAIVDNIENMLDGGC